MVFAVILVRGHFGAKVAVNVRKSVFKLSVLCNSASADFDKRMFRKKVFIRRMYFRSTKKR